MKARIRFYAMGQSMAARNIDRVGALALAGMRKAPRWACNAFLDGFEDQSYSSQAKGPFKLHPHQRHAMRRLMPAFERGGLPEVSLVPHPPVRPLRTNALDPEGLEHQWLESQGRFYVPGLGFGKASHVVHIKTPINSESIVESLSRKNDLYREFAHSLLINGYDPAKGEIDMQYTMQPVEPMPTHDFTAGTSGPSTLHDGTE